MRGDRLAQRSRRKIPLRRQAGAPFYSYKERLGTGSPLIRPSVRTGAPSPEGKALGGGKDPSRLRNPPFPARPAGGRAVTGVGSWAAGQAEKKRGPPQGPPQPEKVGPGRKNLFLPGVLPPAFFQRKPGPPRAGRATGAAPRGFEKAPTTRRVRSTHRPRRGRRPSHVSGSGSPRMVASGWKMAQKKSLSRARISRSSR